MKKFGKECDHARRERESKWLYSEAERVEGCWVCGGALTEAGVPKLTSLEEMNADDATREEFRRMSPEEQSRWLATLNRPQYQCVPCFTRQLEQNRREGGYIPAEKILEEFRDGTADRRRRELIAEVEACGPDCPWYDRLGAWRS